MFDFDKMDEQSLPGHFLYGGQRINYRYFAGTKARELEKTFQKIADLEERSQQAARNGEDDDLSAEERKLVDDGGRYAICEALVGVLDELNVKDMPLDAKKMADHPKASTAFYTLLARSITGELMNGGVQARKSAR